MATGTGAAASAGDTIRVVIADDHPIVRAGLAAVIESTPDIDVVGQAATAAEAVELVRQAGADASAPERIDVVLMDLRFGDSPGASSPAGGVDATAEIRSLGVAAPQVLVVTNYSSDADVLGAITAGAVGYLLKDADPEELVDGIRRAARGETVLSNHVAGRLMGQIRQPMTVLTPRELEVLRLVAGGMSNKAIARELVLTEATVKTHLVHVFTKLDVTSRTAAVARAKERGILGD